jgi:hypothetical protein
MLYKRIDTDPDCTFRSTKLRCMKSEKSAMMSRAIETKSDLALYNHQTIGLEL